MIGLIELVDKVCSADPVQLAGAESVPAGEGRTQSALETKQQLVREIRRLQLQLKLQRELNAAAFAALDLAETYLEDGAPHSALRVIKKGLLVASARPNSKGGRNGR